jgi:H+/Cl- antiporter ClcA
VVRQSVYLYSFVRSNPLYLPLLLLGAALLGLAASRILSRSRSCRGGGIPTSVTAIRGIVSFRWVAGVFILPFSALLTFLCGIPLGTEGPCVQMGTAVGNSVVSTVGSKKQTGWKRYIMTGGASAGFSVATSSPITAIIFSMEELHKHFSPLLLTVASLSVISAQLTAELLSLLGLGSLGLFEIPALSAMETKLFFVPLLVGLICGIVSILFTRLYRSVDRLVHAVRSKLPIQIVFPILFTVIAAIGFFFADALGTGHGLAERLLRAETLWYLLLFTFLIRMLIMMVSNTAGATGGIFLPTIAFGAIIGSLTASGLIALGWINPEHYTLIVVLGITAFLGATSRIPITACVFALEALGGIHNVLSVIAATTVALLTVEMSGLEDFTDTVIQSKINAIHRGQKPTVIQVPLTVRPDSFVLGKEMRDILWPNACSIVSFERAPENRGTVGIGEGDIITVHYETYHPDVASEEFRILVGEQSEEIQRIMNAKTE